MSGGKGQRPCLLFIRLPVVSEKSADRQRLQKTGETPPAVIVRIIRGDYPNLPNSMANCFSPERWGKNHFYSAVLPLTDRAGDIKMTLLMLCNLPIKIILLTELQSRFTAQNAQNSEENP